MIPQLYEAISFLKSNKKILEYSQELISRVVSIKLEYSHVYKQVKEDEAEEKRTNEKNWIIT